MTIRKVIKLQIFIFVSALWIMILYFCLVNTNRPSNLLLKPYKHSAAMLNTQDSFNSAESMIFANLTEGQIVTTKGFYFAGDGGGATYFITNHISETSKFPMFHLNNGLLAVLQVNNNTVSVDSLGARGDGVSDDAPYIQAALDSGYKVSFGKEKTYRLVSNGLMVNTENIEIIGNGSRILIDDGYTPSNPELKKYVFRGSYSQHNKMEVSNLNFDIKISHPKYAGSSSYLCIIHPLFFDDITLKNVNTSIASSNNNITNFWMFHGCKKLSFEKCSFENNTTRKEGGILFIHSRTDTAFGRYNAFRSITMSDCIFTGTCGDELLAIWGPNNITAQIDNCVFSWNRATTENTSRMITVSSKEDATCNYNVTFSNCQFLCKSAGATTCDAFLGVGSVNPATKINVSFSNCAIYADVANSLLHFQYYRSLAPKISLFNYISDRYKIIFDSCGIISTKTLTGSSHKYDPTSGTTWALDSTFNNCDITCKYCAVYLQYDETLSAYYAPKVTLSNNRITISNSLGLIYKNNEGANGEISIYGNTLKTDGNSNNFTTAQNGSDIQVNKQANTPN